MINESEQNVELARELLIMIYRPIIKYVYPQRILSGILSYQQFLIFEFQVEGRKELLIGKNDGGGDFIP